MNLVVGSIERKHNFLCFYNSVGFSFIMKLWNILCSVCVLVLTDKFVHCSIKVEYGNTTFGPYGDEEGEFGGSYIGVFYGILVVGNPRNACGPLQPHNIYTGQNVFVLIDDGGCSDYEKLRNARAAEYSAAIVRSTDSDDLITMKGPNIDMLGLYVGKTTGETLQKYNYTTKAIIEINLKFSLNLELYLIPLVIIIGICFILMVLFLFIKYWRTRILERRTRLTPANLKKIPTQKYKEGDDFDLCAICLEDYKVGDKLRVLPCDHAYHTKCVDPWLTNGKKTCPVCKRPVEKDKTDENETRVAVTDANERTPLLNDGQPSTSHHSIDSTTNAEVV